MPEENINNLAFDEERIVFLVTYKKEKSTSSRVEFRTRDMFAIGYITLTSYNINFSYILCPLKDGYLLGERKQVSDPLRITLIDNNLKQHEQKIFSSYGIINIQTLKIFEQPIYKKNIQLVPRSQKVETVTVIPKK